MNATLMLALREGDRALYGASEKLEDALNDVEHKRGEFKRLAYVEVCKISMCHLCGKEEAQRVVNVPGGPSAQWGTGTLPVCLSCQKGEPVRCSHFGMGKCIRFAIINRECWVHAPWPSE